MEAMGPVGWARRPHVIGRKLVADYPGMVDAFKRAMPYASAAAGGAAVACLLCGEAPATRAFLPCAHACVCDACMARENIGPMRADVGAAAAGSDRGGGAGGGGGPGKTARGGSHYLSWDMCAC